MVREWHVKSVGLWTAPNGERVARKVCGFVDSP